MTPGPPKQTFPWLFQEVKDLVAFIYQDFGSYENTENQIAYWGLKRDTVMNYSLVLDAVMLTGQGML